MNNDDGALYVPLTGDSKQFIGALDEAERRVKGFSSATVAEGKKIDQAFENLARKITSSKELIAATEADIKKMEGMMKTIAPGAAKVDLISELGSAKRALQEQKAALADYEGQVKSAAAAHVTLGIQLRRMKEELVAMEAAGKRGTKEYEDLQGSFAKLTQQMSHAQKQANVLAHDQAGLQGVIQALSGVAGIAAAAQGAIGLFSGENENLQKVMMKVQSLMSLTIGLQQTQQLLNKDSAFSLVILTRVKTALAAAELKLAAAFGISTAAARILMATLTLGLSVAIGVAIAAISRFVNKSQEAKKATQEFNKATAEEAYKTLASFEKMRLEWNRLGDDMKAKNRFIKDNKDAFEELGIQIKGAADAESIFVKNTEAFRTALLERAKSIAAYEMASALAKKLVEKELERDATPAREEHYVFSGLPGQPGIPGQGGTTVEKVSERRDEWVDIETQRAFIESEIRKLFETGHDAAQKATSIINDLGLTTTENLKKIVLLEQKISEQERLMLEAVEAGNTQEAKLIAGRIEKLQEELRLRNMLVNAIYAQGRANELLSNSQADAWKPSGLNIKVGAPSTGGKPAGARYWQTPVFDLETAKKTLTVMDAQAATARNAEAVAKKKKKVDEDIKEIDEETKKIAEEELKIRMQIADAIAGITSQLAKQLGLEGEAMDFLNAGLTAAVQLASGDWIEATITMLSELITLIPTQAEKVAKQVEIINRALTEQERLIELAERIGGTETELKKELAILKELAKVQENEYKRLQNEANTHVDLLGWRHDKAKEAYDIWQATTDQIEDANIELEDFYAGNIQPESIADAISEGFQDGKESAADFADTFNDFMRQAIDSALKEMSKPAVAEWYKKLAEDMASGGGLTDEEIDALKIDWDKIAEDNRIAREAAYGIAGMSPTEATDATLQGAVKGITEQTAGVLAGQFNAMRINQVEGIQIIRQQLMHLAEIAANTRYNKNLERLPSIDRKLDALSADPLRAQGLNG